MNRPTVLLLGGQGYIGAALAAHLEAAALPVCSIDLGLRGFPSSVPNHCMRYQDLTADELEAFDSIVLLAGHSSVPACDREPVAAFANNVAGFVDFVHRLRGQKLVFGSSVLVYINTAGRLAEEDEPLPPATAYYDLHKQSIERYAALVYPNSYALRFGTVCGPSPNLRTDLPLNRLVRTAMSSGRVEVANGQTHRPLLGMGDLCRAIETILIQRVPPGCYNLASANVQIGKLVDYVARRFAVPCVEVEMPSRYDIQVSTRTFHEVSGMEFRDRVDDLVEALAQFYAAHPEARSAPHGS